MEGYTGKGMQDADGKFKGHLAAFQVWNGDGEAHLNKQLDGNFLHFPLSLIPTRFLLGEQVLLLPLWGRQKWK